MIKQLDYPAYANSGFQRISWGAVFAGTIVSLATLVTLYTLGTGIGFVVAPSVSGQGAAGAADAAKGLGIGAAAWMLVSGICAYFAGGWVAGRLTGIARVSESVIHGIVMWALGTVMLAFVLTSATVGALGAASGAVSGAVRSTIGTPGAADAAAPAADAAADAAARVDTEDIAGASRAAGAAGLFGFLMLLCNAGAAGYGARSGTRVLRPVAMSESHRERVSH